MTFIFNRQSERAASGTLQINTSTFFFLYFLRFYWKINSSLINNLLTRIVPPYLLSTENAYDCNYTQLSRFHSLVLHPEERDVEIE